MLPWGFGKLKYPGTDSSQWSPVMRSVLQVHFPVATSQMKVVEPSSLHWHSKNIY